MTKQEWEKMRAEELQQSINGFAEYLLDEGLAVNEDHRILDLKGTKRTWWGVYELELKQAAIAWNKAYKTSIHYKEIYKVKG